MISSQKPEDSFKDGRTPASHCLLHFHPQVDGLLQGAAGTVLFCEVGGNGVSCNSNEPTGFLSRRPDERRGGL